MTNNDLVRALMYEAGLKKDDARKAIRVTFDTIARGITSGTSVQIIGFGKFYTKTWESRMMPCWKNISANDVTAPVARVLKKHTRVTFKPSKVLKEAVRSARDK